MNTNHFPDITIKAPVVGVLTTRKKGDGYPLPTGKESRIFKEMILAARARGIVMYYFYPDGINWEKGIVRGYTWMNQGWVENKKLPMPDIVYNRILYRRVEGIASVQALLIKIQQASEIYCFNTRFLDKWEVYQALQNHQNAGVMPRTEALSPETLLEFTSQFEEVFIKPCGGSRGKGIIKVRRLSHGGLCYAEASRKTPEWKKAKNDDQLYQQLSHTIKVPIQEMIIQEGIRLARFKGRVFDIRALMQKDGKGEWTYTGAGIRIAPLKGFVTHIPNGGTKADIDEFIPKVFGNHESLDDLKRQIIHLVRWVPKSLEEETGLNLAVLSMDLGLDREEKLRLIEVNSKPSSFDEDLIRKQHLENLNDYFLYIHQNNPMRNTMLKRKDR